MEQKKKMNLIVGAVLLIALVFALDVLIVSWMVDSIVEKRMNKFNDAIDKRIELIDDVIDRHVKQADDAVNKRIEQVNELYGNLTALQNETRQSIAAVKPIVTELLSTIRKKDASENTSVDTDEKDDKEDDDSGK